MRRRAPEGGEEKAGDCRYWVVKRASKIKGEEEGIISENRNWRNRSSEMEVGCAVTIGKRPSWYQKAAPAQGYGSGLQRGSGSFPARLGQDVESSKKNNQSSIAKKVRSCKDLKTELVMKNMLPKQKGHGALLPQERDNGPKGKGG